MEQRRLLQGEQLRFAGRALALRYPEPGRAGMDAGRLLACRRAEDAADDLWSVLNRIEEHLMVGGPVRRSVTGRWVRTRRITCITSEVS